LSLTPELVLLVLDVKSKLPDIFLAVLNLLHETLLLLRLFCQLLFHVYLSLCYLLLVLSLDVFEVLFHVFVLVVHFLNKLMVFIGQLLGQHSQLFLQILIL